jgi:spore coat polysaccharide biosynthesis protein SpsF
MHKNRNKFRVVGLENSVDDSQYRFVVDRREDFEVVSAIINDLYRSNEKPFGMRRVKQYLDQNPEIYAINCDLVRNESYNAFRLIS